MIKDLKVSMFKGPITNVINPREITIGKMIDDMINPTESIKSIINTIRTTNVLEISKSLKNKLPYYVVTGLFKENEKGNKYRSTEFFIEKSYTYIIPIDIDSNKDNEFNIDDVFKKLKGIPGIFFIIKSVRGKGIKALLNMVGNYPSELHSRVCKELIYPQIGEHIGCKLDNAQGVLTQPFFYTTSDDYYLNFDIEPVEIDISNLKEKPIFEPLDTIDVDKNIDHIPDVFFEHYDSAIPVMSSCKHSSIDVRKQYYFRFKKLYKGESIPLDSFDLFDNFISQKSFSSIPNFIKQTYKEMDLFDSEEFFNSSKTEIDNSIEKIPLPNITNFVFDNLPDLLKDFVNMFDDKYDKDIILISELTVLSCLFPNVYINYAKNKIYPNIMSLIIGESGIGKGIIKYSIKSINKIIDEERLRYEQAKQMIKNNIITNKKNKNKNFDDLPTTMPKIKRTLLSTDTSYKSLFDNLYNNNGEGLLYTSELDTISKNNKTDWGGYSELIRMGYQNEGVSISRVDDERHIERLKISLLASGTPGQLPKYIPNKEDGHFGRHIFYYIDKKFEVMDTNGLFSSMDYDKHINLNFSNKIKEIYDFYNNKNYEFEIVLLEKSKIKWKNFLDSTKNKFLIFDDKRAGIVSRIGTTGIKIITLLTILRNYDKDIMFGNLMKTLTVDDIDVDVVINLYQSTLINHIISFYDSLLNTESININQKISELNILDYLKPIFTRKDLMEIVKKTYSKINMEKKSDYLIKVYKSKNLINKLDFYTYSKKM